ncbi:uncharacterized protein A4U43_C06F12490 [Asparagus officinalis]|uniref:Uncharacterized protein n=1 Tax=Asparagus officinalis TaxID=4686 RepID=A0A5P1EM20_ASPOF|nr:uncharacterized protein A4U43_C06F12490 [Asparagus officinalis]
MEPEEETAEDRERRKDEVTEDSEGQRRLGGGPSGEDEAEAKIRNRSGVDEGVSTGDGKSLAEKESLYFMETSALEATNVENAFSEVLTQI